jgi:hypothetical protein
MKHYGIRTEQAYVDWFKRYIFFHNKRHPQVAVLLTCKVGDKSTNSAASTDLERCA